MEESLSFCLEFNMDLFNVTIIAIGLSMDAFAVSVTAGFSYKQIKLKHALLMASFFGFFQAFMPVAGYFSGSIFSKSISRYGNYIAFALLSIIGLKMIYESIFLNEKEKELKNPFKLLTLLALSIATSIDALAAGFTIACLSQPIVLPAFVIGLCTFLFTVTGNYTGKKIGHLFENKIEIIGGLVLIGLGIKILIEHLAMT